MGGVMTALPKITYAFKKILTGSDLSRRRLPFMSTDSGVPGPVVWLTACSHGDEVGSIVIIQEIFKAVRKPGILQKGSLFAFPLMNPVGFEARSRHIPHSQEDLNRSFPGDPKGSMGERIAALIFDTILETAPSLVVDLHNDWTRSIPYALIDIQPETEFMDVYRQTENFAQQCGFLTIRDMEKLTGSLSAALHRHHVPALTMELGESFVVNEDNIRYGVSAVNNLLVHLGMISGDAKPFLYPLPEQYRHRILHYWSRPFAASTGILRFMVKPGDNVLVDQPIARIYNAFGRRQEVMRARKNGVVLGHSDFSAAFPGMPVMAFGVEGG